MFCVVCVMIGHGHHDIVVEFVPAFDLWFVVAFYHLRGTH